MKDNTKALSSKINKEEIDILLGRVDVNSSYLDEKVDEVVNNYCKPLDNLMAEISQALESRIPVSEQQLDSFALRLPQTMFYVGEGQESIGIRDDVSDAIRQDAFNRIHSETVGTVADKNAKAELASQQEYIVNTIFARAYKKIRLRMEQGSEMLASIKKVMSRRMIESELTGLSSSNFNRGPQAQSSFNRRRIEE